MKKENLKPQINVSIENPESLSKFEIPDFYVPCNPTEYWEETEMYYDRILTDLDTKISMLKGFQNNLNEQSINEFKSWFVKEFGDIKSNKTSDIVFKDWTNDQMTSLLVRTIQHLKDDYFTHQYGGFPLFFIEHYRYLCNVAKGIKNATWDE